ncbi:hypothetical protein V6U81_08655 [Micromonospora sp. CPCC 205711]|uniref:hypothetical protein n=1 Tax=Micromonospora sp. CPCC 205547 TaxID=3122400 RepID=UPI002FF27D4A
MTRRYVLWLALTVGLLAGCSEPQYALPDRGTADVQAEERRLASLLPGELLSGPGTCKVRLIGREGSSSFAWAQCEGAPEPGVTSGVSMPVRVDGDKVSRPLDGAEYSASVKRMFPGQLVDAILDDRDKLHP